MVVSATWAATTALKVSAAFRHVAQAACKCRGWVPEDSRVYKVSAFGISQVLG